GCDGVTVTNNRFEHVRSAVYAQDSSRIVVTYNRCLNVQGPMPRGQFTQFNRVNGPGSRINFNFVENILGQNHAEDAINIFNSNGREKDPIQIIGNRIRGSSISPSGGGIMTGDGSGSYILVQNNTLVNPGQYGIAIAGGNHIQILSNRVFGQKQSFTNVGIYAWNQSTIPSYGHTVRGNQVKWFNKNGKLNSSWDGGNVGSIAGWKNNNWNADLDSSIITPRSMREARQLMAPMKLLGEYNEQ
ncbi:MAG: right-handed parallel beta-helix repeat-containing protein, partial [Thermoguttaceae bacterium]